MRRTIAGGFLAFFNLLILCTVAQAQLTGPMTGPGGAPQSLVRQDKLLTPSTSDNTIYDGAINASEYHLGPGDILQMRLWTLEETYPLTVSPDQILIVPRIGEFSVKGKTLETLRDSIYARASQIFRSTGSPQSNRQEKPITVSLYQPRKILIRVEGDVLNPSLYSLTGGTRSGVAISLANRPVLEVEDENTRLERRRKREESQRMGKFFGDLDNSTASQRYITIVHDDGSTDRLDLVKYGATHDGRYAPLLREGDVLHVPPRDPAVGTISVYGGVQAPGDFEFVPGESLYSMIMAAIGPTEFADLTHVELTRSNPSTGEYSTHVYDAAAIRDHRSPDVPLMTGDRIIVRSILERHEVARVAVSGETEHPGVYPVQKGKTKLSEVLKNSGGFTKDAFPSGVMLFRKWSNTLKTTPADEERQVTRVANLSMYDTSVFRQQYLNRMPMVTVDCERLFAKGDSSADVTLEDQDMVVVPKISNSVYVSGYVASAGFIGFVKGADVNYYIAAAGGYVDGAVKGRTRVIKARTKTWAEPSETQIEPGDEVYVPKETELPAGTALLTISALASIGFFALSLFSTLYDRLKKP